MKKITPIQQVEAAECGLTCLTMILNYYGKNYSLKHLRDKYFTSFEGMSLSDIRSIAEQENLIPMTYSIDNEDVNEIITPCIAFWEKKHFVVIESINKKNIIIIDPASGRQTLSFKEFNNKFSNIICELQQNSNFKQDELDKNDKENNNNFIFKLLSTIKNIKSQIFNIIIMSITLELFIMTTPLFNKIIVDHVILNNNHSILYATGIGFFLLIIFQYLANFSRDHMLLFLSTNLQKVFKYELLDKLLKLPVTYFQRRGYGSILSRFESLEEIKNKISNGLIEGIVSGVSMLFSGLFMFYLNYKLATIVFFILILILIFRLYFIKKQEDYINIDIENIADEQNFIIETLKTIESSKVHNQEQLVFYKWYEKYIKQLKYFLKLNKLNININAFQNFILNFQRLLVVWIGGAEVLNNNMTLGVLFAFISYQIFFSMQFALFVKNIIDFRLLKSHFERVNDIKLESDEEYLHGKIPENDFVNNFKGKIELKNIYFKYPGKEEYLFENFNLIIEAGESVVFTGNSGCGKSTLLKIMAGLIPIEKGDIYIDGLNIKDIGKSNYRNNIGFILQGEDQLYSGSVLENIVLFNKKYKIQDVYDAAEKACISEEIKSLKMNYETVITSLGSVFSGGQKQRIIMARTLYRKPKILFIDEGTSALDIELEKRIINNLKKEKMTRISIAHREESKKLADRIIDLSKAL